MDANGKSDLKQPLLDGPGSVTINISQLSDGLKNTRTLKFRTLGIECASCTNSIESMLQKLDGIESVAVSPMDGISVVEYMPIIINVKAIKETIENAGFEVEGFPEQEDITVCRLRIKGMACTSCSESVERALSLVDGVKKAVVGLALEQAKVNFDPNVTNPKQIVEAVEDAGFEADIISPGNVVNKVHLKLDGIHTPKDAKSIRSALESAVGVDHVDVDIEGCKASISLILM